MLSEWNLSRACLCIRKELFRKILQTLKILFHHHFLKPTSNKVLHVCSPKMVIKLWVIKVWKYLFPITIWSFFKFPLFPCFLSYSYLLGSKMCFHTTIVDFEKFQAPKVVHCGSQTDKISLWYSFSFEIQKEKENAYILL